MKNENDKEQIKKATISILVRNRFGVLTRIAALFSGRGYNIDSLSVTTVSEDDQTSKMTIVTHGDEETLEQIEKQLGKLIDVIQVIPLEGKEFISRELMIIKVKADAKIRAEIVQIVQVFRAQIISIHSNSIVMQVTGKSEKLDSFIDMMEQFGIIEIVRSGPLGMLRSDETTQNINIESF